MSMQTQPDLPDDVDPQVDQSIDQDNHNHDDDDEDAAFDAQAEADALPFVHPEDEEDRAIAAAEFVSMALAARQRREAGREDGRPPRDDDFPRPAVAAAEGPEGTQASPFAPPGDRAVHAQLEAVAPKLHKVLADAGVGSRREMEELILAGRVSVNGEPAHVGQRVEPTDQIRVNGKPLQRRTPKIPRVLLYHKPAGEIVTQDDPEKRATVFERLPQVKGSRWVAVGRLDFNTEGLLLFTTSGDLANRLMHPRFEQERVYAVRCIPALDDEAKRRLLEGVELEDGPAQFARLDDAGGDGANHWYHVLISEGRNREVRRMFEAVGVTVSRLIRVRYGPVDLPRTLKRGRFQEISSLEAACLCASLGMKLVEPVDPRRARPGRRQPGMPKPMEVSPLATTVEAMFGVSPVKHLEQRGVLSGRKVTIRARGPDGEVDGNVMSNDNGVVHRVERDSNGNVAGSNRRGKGRPGARGQGPFRNAGGPPGAQPGNGGAKRGWRRGGPNADAPAGGQSGEPGQVAPRRAGGNGPAPQGQPGNGNGPRGRRRGRGANPAGNGAGSNSAGPGGGRGGNPNRAAAARPEGGGDAAPRDTAPRPGGHPGGNRRRHGKPRPPKV